MWIETLMYYSLQLRWSSSLYFLIFTNAYFGDFTWPYNLNDEKDKTGLFLGQLESLHLW